MTHAIFLGSRSTSFEQSVSDLVLLMNTKWSGTGPRLVRDWFTRWSLVCSWLSSWRRSFYVAGFIWGKPKLKWSLDDISLESFGWSFEGLLCKVWFIGRWWSPKIIWFSFWSDPDSGFGPFWVQSGPGVLVHVGLVLIWYCFGMS